MRKNLTIIALMAAFFFLSGEKSWAQSGWVWQNPLPIGDGLGNVRFFSATEGWMSTESGGLLHTTNGGASWEVVTPDPNIVVTSITEPQGPAAHFISASTGWITGVQGGFADPQGPTLYRTTNSGASWTSQPVGSGVANAIFGLGVYFVNANLGWAALAAGSFPVNVDGVLRKSTDGGTSWGTVFTAPPNQGIFSLQFLDANNGWAIMDSVSDTQADLIAPTMIIRTTDGGSSWDTLTFDPTPGTFNALQFLDLNIGWVVGDSTKIYHTTNGGVGWSQISNTGIPAGYRCRALFFLNASNGWIAADDTSSNKFLVHTTDGGANWANQNTGLNSSLRGIHFIDASNGWVCADFGEIARTTDGGANWTPQSSAQFTSNLRGVASLPNDIARFWTVGQFGTILRSTDGGTTWSFPSSPPSIDNFHGVSFVDANTGYAVGDLSAVKTTDGGNTWSNVTPSVHSGIYAVDFVNASLGWAAGQFGEVYKTTDGGGSWSQSTPGSPDLHGVYFVDASNGWVVGNSGRIYWTTNGGTSWSSQTSNTNRNLNGVDFVDLLNGAAVGDSGTILHTTDGGTTWSPQTSGFPNNLYGVAFTDANNGTAVGDGRIILNTTDGGATWTHQFGGASQGQALWGVSFANSTTGMAIGDNGTVLHIGQVGTDAPKEKINRPAGFELSQNYPNPFNPTTSIRFSLLKRQKVTLEIFNLLGERVKLLANDEKTAGEHTVVWDGRDDKGRTLSSGVYFYRLKGEDFAETKRMIFLK